jgi:hypothetical protein
MLEEIDKLIRQAADVKKHHIKNADNDGALIAGVRIMALQDARRIMALYLAQGNKS